MRMRRCPWSFRYEIPTIAAAKTRGSADAQRPARAKTISDPTDNGRADGRAAQGDGEEDGHHPSTHDGLGGELHQAVRRGGEGLGGDADDDQRGAKEPVARHDRGERAAGPESSQAGLARATGTDPTLTGRALETLIERGWIRRERSEEDRRQYVLELTDAGQRARKRVEEARKRLVERVVAELDERDIEDFERIAKKLLTAFEGSVDDSTKP